MGHLFEEVRQYAAPVQLHFQMIDVGQLIDETWDLLTLTRKGRDVRLLQPDTDLNLECEIDRFHIRNAIRNILENSLAACDDPVEIDIDFSEVQDTNRRFLRIAIRDNGPGFTPDQAKKVFDAFYTTKTHGTGLGLSITKRLVERHGGQVKLGSDYHNGAEIVLTLPRSQP
ncbi:Sensor protein ZraS [Gimesia algae]|uniref:histidine kinase n=2 Tax=Gimesia algae TaxID=2527971 RepID=A0A517VEU2_9PLAN|nr:Sensor protein ZraS [Gimesia algae]